MAKHFHWGFAQCEIHVRVPLTVSQQVSADVPESVRAAIPTNDTIAEQQVSARASGDKTELTALQNLACVTNIPGYLPDFKA